MSWSDEETILIDIYFTDLVAIRGFEYNSLAVFDSTNQNLRKWHVGKFKFALVAAFFQTNLKDVDWTAKRAKAYLWTILTPSAGGNRVVVLNLFAGYFVPLRSLVVEVIDIETVKVSDNAGLTSSIETSTSELLNFFVLWVVKALETVSSWFVKRDFSIITASDNVRSPSKSIRNCWVIYLRFCFGVQVKGDEGVV